MFYWYIFTIGITVFYKSILSWVKRLKKQKVIYPPHNQIRIKVDTNTIRERLQGLGWKLLEIPVRRQDKIIRWKIVASRGEQSVETTGLDIDEAMKSVGVTLGVIPRD